MNDIQFTNLTKEQIRDIPLIKRIQSSDVVLKIKSKKIKFGSVVRLKSQSELGDKYKAKVKSLIGTGHRFVIGPTFDKNSVVVPIILLSTSSFANQEHEKGWKFTGNYGEYGNGKDVYVDCTHIYLIHKNCISSFEYQLEPMDIHYLQDMLMVHGNTSEIDVGIYNSIVQSKLNDYKYLFHSVSILDKGALEEDAPEKLQKEYLEEEAMTIIDKLPAEELAVLTKDILSDMCTNTSNEIEALLRDYVMYFKEKYKDIDEATAYRLLLYALTRFELQGTTSDELYDVIKSMKRNYI